MTPNIPTDHLRAIAVTVIEPEPGRFHWMILKSMDDMPIFGERDISPEAFVSWAGALDMGVAALKWLADDLKWGPRTVE